MARMTTVPVHKHGCKKKDTSLCPLKQFNSSEALSYQAGQKFDLGNYGTPPQTCAKDQGASAWLPLTYMVPWCELDKGAHSGGDTDEHQAHDKWYICDRHVGAGIGPLCAYSALRVLLWQLPASIPSPA